MFEVFAPCGPGQNLTVARSSRFCCFCADHTGCGAEQQSNNPLKNCMRSDTPWMLELQLQASLQFVDFMPKMNPIPYSGLGRSGIVEIVGSSTLATALQL